MPSTATITAFYSFTANTKARASQVNGNFDLFRGHLLPIDPNTQTAISNAYDLGSTEYKWRTGYFGSLNITSNTTTGNDLTISGETTSSNPAFIFKSGSTELARIQPTLGFTSTASKGGIAISSEINLGFYLTSGAAVIAGSTITIESTGKLMVFGWTQSPNTNSTANFTMAPATTTSDRMAAGIYINTLHGLRGQSYIVDLDLTTTAGNGVNISSAIPTTAFFFGIFPAGTQTFYMQTQVITSQTELAMSAIRVFAKEIL